MSAGKYAALTRYLSQLPAGQASVTLAFNEIGTIVGGALPPSAHKFRPWWGNQIENANRPQARGWMDAGFLVQTVDFGARAVRFVRSGRASIEAPPGRTSIVSQPVPGCAAQSQGEPRTEQCPRELARRQDGVPRIVLIACAATKLEHRAAAQDLYVSALFRASLAYARSLKPKAIYILSAKHGLVKLDTELDPYNLTLKDLSPAEVRAWSARVLGQLGREANLEGDHFVILAGDAYRRYLVPKLSRWVAPLEGLPIGKQLQRLNELLRG